MAIVTKSIKRELRIIAARIPASYYEANHKSWKTGKQLLSAGIKEHAGQPIKEDGKYLFQSTWQHPVNPVRQLQRAYEAKGKDGVIEYVKAQHELHRPHPMPVISAPQS